MEASSEGETGRVGRDTVIGIEVVDVELTCENKNQDDDDDGLSRLNTVIRIGAVGVKLTWKI